MLFSQLPHRVTCSGEAYRNSFLYPSLRMVLCGEAMEGAQWKVCHRAPFLGLPQQVRAGEGEGGGRR